MSKNKYRLIFILTIVILTLSACVTIPDDTEPLTENIKVMPTSSENAALPTLTTTAAPVPTNTAPPTPQAEKEPENSTAIVWKATHETGNISEWQQHGDFINQGQSAYYSMATPFAHSGKYSVSLTIDTEGLSNTGSYAAYLFYWDQLPEDAYYYSAWYYIPAGTHPQDWWNIWQWKSTHNGNTDDSVPMYIIDVLEQANGQLALHLVYRPDIDEKIDYRQDSKTVPTDEWFHIEAYYKKAVNNSGQVIVWQDGEELFNLSDIQTTERDNTVYWSINHYTDYILPNPSSIYIDDAAISLERIGPNYMLPY
jgi:Polysaccharide lyase